MFNQTRDLWIRAQFQLRSRLLGQLRLRSDRLELGENPWDETELNFYTEVIKTCFHPQEAAQILRVVDVGFRNGSYLKALSDAFPNAEIMGVEVDAYRRYLDLYTRKDYAMAYAETLRKFENKTVSLFFQDFAELGSLPQLNPTGCSSVTPEQTLFCFFFPFVSERPCQKWGLPKKYVQMKKLLNNCRKLTQGDDLTQGGKWPRILTVHQGDWEGELMRQNYEELGLPFKCWIFDVEKVSELQRVPAYENWIFLTG